MYNGKYKTRNNIEGRTTALEPGSMPLDKTSYQMLPDCSLLTILIALLILLRTQGLNTLSSKGTRFLSCGTGTALAILVINLALRALLVAHLHA